MRISRIYTEQPLIEHTNQVLNSDTSHYLLKVLRLTIGNQIILFNGDNHSYNAIITSIKPLTVNLIHKELINTESKLRLHLIQGLLNSDKMDLVIQKATELGVNEITPVFTQYSEIKLNSERIENKLKHWNKIIQSSCEQNGRNILPFINAPIALTTLLTTREFNPLIILNPATTIRLSTFEFSPIAATLTLLVGPEGGLSENEISLAHRYNATSVTLGKRILRTETAAIACLAAAQTLWGDF